MTVWVLYAEWEIPFHATIIGVFHKVEDANEQLSLLEEKHSAVRFWLENWIVS